MVEPMQHAHMLDVVVIGAGAAGLMCAATAGQRGKSVVVVDHASKPAEKIRISGGGRCNFTNIHCAPQHFISANPRFCISALKSYTPHDFIKLVQSYGIAYVEKTLGQLFCVNSASEIISMLLQECQKNSVKIHMNESISRVTKSEQGFVIHTSQREYLARNLVVATGGLSIPKIGATGLGYEIAKQFSLPIVSTRAGLVPFLLDDESLQDINGLSGISVSDSVAKCGKVSFREAMLFTHRGLSGPAILQISSYWREGEFISVNMSPDVAVFEWLKKYKTEHPKQEIETALAYFVSKRLAQALIARSGVVGKLADLSHAQLQKVAAQLESYTVVPSATEGYRTAEVTLGGVDTRSISSKTMEVTSVAGLYFIGEVLDVTGHLGGHNFQWAWSSGVAAGRAVQ
jgi:predicted Rossmann fold flavoprotein